MFILIYCSYPFYFYLFQINMFYIYIYIQREIERQIGQDRIGQERRGEERRGEERTIVSRLQYSGAWHRGVYYSMAWANALGIGTGIATATAKAVANHVKARYGVSQSRGWTLCVPTCERCCRHITWSCISYTVLCILHQ